MVGLALARAFNPTTLTHPILIEMITPEYVKQDNEMSKNYSKSNPVMFVGGVMLKMQKMKAELNELRYFFEKSLEMRTEYLSRRIALLESCNATLCDKLASSQEKSAELHAIQQTRNNPVMKLYVSNTNRMLPVVAGMKEHAAAA